MVQILSNRPEAFLVASSEFKLSPTDQKLAEQSSSASTWPSEADPATTQELKDYARYASGQRRPPQEQEKCILLERIVTNTRNWTDSKNPEFYPQLTQKGLTLFNKVKQLDAVTPSVRNEIIKEADKFILENRKYW